MSKILKGAAITATAFLIGSSLSVSASWKDSWETDYTLGSPHATAELVVNTNQERLNIIDEDGSLPQPLNMETNPHVETELFTAEELRSLAETRQLAKVFTMNVQTHGNIGLNKHSLQWDSDVMEYGYTEASGDTLSPEGETLADTNPQITAKGALLEDVDTDRSKIITVSDPTTCSTDLLDDTTTDDTDLLQPHLPGETTNALYASNSPQNASGDANDLNAARGIGANEHKQDNVCILLEVPERVDIPGEHNSTTTITAESTITGEEVTGESTLQVDTINAAQDYSDEAEEQIAEGLTNVRMEIMTSNLNGEPHIYTHGNYSYEELEQD